MMISALTYFSNRVFWSSSWMHFPSIFFQHWKQPRHGLISQSINFTTSMTSPWFKSSIPFTNIEVALIVSLTFFGDASNTRILIKRLFFDIVPHFKKWFSENYWYQWNNHRQEERRYRFHWYLKKDDSTENSKKDWLRFGKRVE